ncbi:trypsin-like serine peptidase [Actinacidiphila acidipaludis]|uniref:Serine protease n=1 Tax=Actinacidiphila acidipaludis TaxID=2873382 RepID=A0ABS7QH54_9ACTN|nr:serine protease [Streptomyces acidipaludis]MBY8882004.1 serine protease [Streptomyces acidipaludis]
MLRFTRAKLLTMLSGGLAVLGVMAAAPALADPPPPPGAPTATPFDGISTVGPLFRNGLDHNHGCTASVVASPGHDLLLAAAHCVSGTAAGWQFAPGYRNGQTPYGVWTVTRAYVDPHWLRDQDPQYDYAVLEVADQSIGGRRTGVEDVTGANILGRAPRAGQTITDVAYNAGIGDRPVKCTTTVYDTNGFPSFNCHGYVGGSSGSPWLSEVPATGLTEVDGVIGGLHQGGCYEYTSYSSAFTWQAWKLLLRASLGLRPDVVPAAGSDGC